VIFGTWLFGKTNEAKKIFLKEGQGRLAKKAYAFAYSLDMHLPVVRLHEPHYTITLHGPTRYYFFIHKIMGYVLVSLLFAGLTGILE